MDDWRLDPLVGRVVAWHNRHPLARRIGPQHVQGLGFVALPHVVPGAKPGATGEAATNAAPQVSSAPAGGTSGGSLRERALAQAQARQPAAASADPPPVAAEPPLPSAAHESRVGSVVEAAFSDRFIDGLAPKRVVRWAALHAPELAAAPAGGPLRQVAVDDALVRPGSGVVMRYAMTAAVQAGGARTRLLVGPAARSPILGRRLWSPPRAAAGGGGAVALLLLALLFAVPAPETAEIELPPRPADWPGIDSAEPASAPPAFASEEVKKVAANKAVNAAVLAAGAAPAAPAVPAAAAATTETPAVATRPVAAEAEARLLAPATAPSAAAEAASAGAAWALTTRPLRTPTESRRLRRALDELLREQGKETLRVEVLPAGDDWRVVGWPFASRNEAERARAWLLARGLRLEVVSF